MALFLGLWIVRLLFFIPGLTLMILGGICFNPLTGFVLSMTGIILSETLVYVVSKLLPLASLNQFLKRKNSNLGKLLEKYNYKFLALGIICPIAPTDAICYLSAAACLNYKTYIFTIILANIPLMLIYSFVGISVSNSLIGITLVILSLVLIAIISVKVWNNLKGEIEVAEC
ncbi:MAG: VTT domain-containing protein [Bacillota bacterium]|nr:VTT domain-containing protein [Bacillota bacterium]